MPTIFTAIESVVESGCDCEIWGAMYLSFGLYVRGEWELFTYNERHISMDSHISGDA